MRSAAENLSRRNILGWGLGAAAWLGGGCGRRAHPAPRKIVVSVRPNLYMAAFYLAQERGYFQQAGLELDLQPVEEGHQVATLLASGKLDVAFSALLAPLVSVIGSGADVRIVAGGQRLTADCSDVGRLWGNRRSFPRGFDSLASLKREFAGKRMALNSLSNTNAYYLDVLLDKAGLRETDIKIVQVRYSEAVTAVLRGRLDAFMSADQFSVQKVADSPELIRGAGLVEALPGFQYRFVSFGKGLLQADPGVGVRFLRAYFKGVADFRKGQSPRFLDEFARSNALDVDRARVSCRSSNAVDGEIDADSVARQVEWYVKKGFCSQKAGAQQMADRRFLQRLQKEGA